MLVRPEKKKAFVVFLLKPYVSLNFAEKHELVRASNRCVGPWLEPELPGRGRPEPTGALPPIETLTPIGMKLEGIGSAPDGGGSGEPTIVISSL